MLNSLSHGIKFFPLIAIAIGCFLVLSYGINYLPEFTRALTIKAEHPSTYRFTLYDGLLKKYVNDGFVDYAKLRTDPDLQKAVQELEKTSPDKLANEREKLCFWLNAYNMMVLKVVCDHYPVNNINQLSQYWGQTKFIVGGQCVTASEAHSKVIQQMADDRLAPNCIFLLCRGSQGYPPLTAHAITPESLEADAKVATYIYVNNSNNCYYDDERLEFYLSPLFKRYESVLRRGHQDPHEFALLYFNTKYPPNLGNMMVTKTYYSNSVTTLNDAALAPKGKKE